jgi:hypothetical protein
MHPAMLRQPTASHIREPATETGDGRRAGKRNAGTGRGAQMLWRQVAARPGSSQTIPGRGGACCATAWCYLTTAGHCFPAARP